jgi:nucleotide-binding universal stress UspA family protein
MGTSYQPTEDTMDVKKILWPTDFSRIAEKALPHVKSLTERYSAEIHVIYVIEDIAHHDGWYGAFEDKRVKELMEHANKTATMRLGQICKKYLDGCPLYIKHVAVGDPAMEILKLIEKEKVDIVVMASHGEKDQFRFGSVAEKVVKNSPVPVTIIPVEPHK